MGRTSERFPEQIEFGRRMRSRREQLGLSQMDLADRCDLHFTYVSSVERGERNVSLRNIVRLAEGLEIDPSKLLERLKPHGR
jgi:transcriptional regulator with XRE-family HTH domain